MIWLLSLILINANLIASIGFNEFLIPGITFKMAKLQPTWPRLLHWVSGCHLVEEATHPCCPSSFCEGSRLISDLRQMILKGVLMFCYSIFFIMKLPRGWRKGISNFTYPNSLLDIQDSQDQVFNQYRIIRNQSILKDTRYTRKKHL